jgi:hypothetical protein
MPMTKLLRIIITLMLIISLYEKANCNFQIVPDTITNKNDLKQVGSEDSIKLIYYDKFTDRIIISMALASNESFYYLIKHDYPDSTKRRHRESNFITGSGFFGLTVNFWKLSYAFGISGAAGYMTTDGSYNFNTTDHSVGFNLSKLNFKLGFNAFTCIIKNDSTNITSRSLKGRAYSFGVKYKFLDKKHVDMLFSNAYRQKKTTFAVSINPIPFYNVLEPFAREDSMFNDAHVPIWGNLTGLQKISVFGVNTKLTLAFNIVFRKWFFGGYLSPGIVWQSTDLKFRDSSLDSKISGISLTGDYAGGIGYNSKRFFIKYIMQYDFLNNELNGFSLNEDSFYGALSLGYRFKKPSWLLNKLKY